LNELSECCCLLHDLHAPSRAYRGDQKTPA
jgi:hypothetical protein